MEQILASYLLPVRRYECTKIRMVKVVTATCTIVYFWNMNHTSGSLVTLCCGCMCECECECVCVCVCVSECECV